MDYKSTLNLPNTAFPMKAGLAEQEPKRVARWQAGDLYHKVLAKRSIDKSYILHDGPPYANNNIHIGTAMNKILKDFVVKSKLGFGFYSPYIPGWDCHGLPIEHKVDKELGEKKVQMSKNEIRKLCREYAAHWLDVQRDSFKRLGVSGDWAKPYITMDYAYEAITLAEFYKVLKSGNLYKGLKPVYWCADCATALAEAEIEYADHVSHSIFVKFLLTQESLDKLGMKEPLSAVIWTTTPWTLPANLGISVHPDEKYSVMRIDEAESANLKIGELIMVAQPLINEDGGLEGAPLREKLKISKWTEVQSFHASALDKLEAKHPFYDERKSLFMLGEHVLMTDGTGLVHTAPGHGQEDYVISMKYGLPVYNPVDDYGKFVKDLPIFGGRKITDANKDIVEHIRANGSLIADGKIKHSYPHCWRCKNPVIYRATPQWFISMETNDLRKKALDAIENKVQWLPAWGANRIHSMVEARPDWCVSRQRAWGVPIALFTCRDCGEIIFDDTIEKKVLDSFKEMGADAWFEHDVAYYLGKDAKCPHCGSADIKQETDILDVWFDSGTSHAAVCEARPEIGRKADMYLEGSDQHRGWFQSSLLESMATRGEAPYRDVLTHGFVMDMEKRKVSKSLGNYIAIEELVKNHGAEILRLWVSGADYTNDVSISQDILKRLVESYRKIRNTARYLLGSIPDFNPDTDILQYEELLELDQYILLRWQDVKKRVYKAYNDYQFHVFYHSFLDFCINELSALYMDVIKDRVYSYAPKSRERRSAQTAMFTLAKEMAVVMSPVLSFTADEIWEYLPVWHGKSEFVFEELFPAAEQYSNIKLEAKFDKLLHVRKAVNKALELSRAAKVIGHPLDAKVLIGVKEPLPTIDEGLSRFLIVSDVEVLDFAKVEGGIANEEGDVMVLVSSSVAEKCARCWTHDHSVGKNSEYNDLCERCAKVMGEL